MNETLKKIKHDIQEGVDDRYNDKFNRPAKFLEGTFNEHVFERVVVDDKERFHCELCLCAGENGPGDELDYLDFITTLLIGGNCEYDEMHLFKGEYDVCDDIGYAYISVVIKRGK